MAASSEDECVRQADLLAQVLPDLVAAGLPPEDDLDAIVGWREVVGLDDPHISEAVLTELRPLLKKHPDLRLTAPPTDEERRDLPQRSATADHTRGRHCGRCWRGLPNGRHRSGRYGERSG
jgi:hypothetical protein